MCRDKDVYYKMDSKEVKKLGDLVIAVMNEEFEEYESETLYILTSLDGDKAVVYTANDDELLAALEKLDYREMYMVSVKKAFLRVKTTYITDEGIVAEKDLPYLVYLKEHS